MHRSLGRTALDELENETQFGAQTFLEDCTVLRRRDDNEDHSASGHAQVHAQPVQRPDLSGRCNKGLKSSAHLQTSNTVGIRAFSHGILRAPSGTPRTIDLQWFGISLHICGIAGQNTAGCSVRRGTGGLRAVVSGNFEALEILQTRLRNPLGDFCLQGDNGPCGSKKQSRQSAGIVPVSVNTLRAAGRLQQRRDQLFVAAWIVVRIDVVEL